MSENIGGKIRELRKANNDTLKGLAEKIGYDWSGLSKIERGQYSAPAELLIDILRVYNVDPHEFIGRPSDGRKLIMDGIEVTESEVAEAIRLIRYIRADKH